MRLWRLDRNPDGSIRAQEINSYSLTINDLRMLYRELGICTALERLA